MGYNGRLIEMKHHGPASPGHVLPCRLGPPFESGVVVNVPASLLHGTVMPLSDQPIHCLDPVGQSSRGQLRPLFRCKECEALRGPATIRERCEPGRWGKASLPDFSEI